MDQNESPPKLPPWVKKETLLPVIGVLLIGLIGGNYLVYRAIKKDARYQATEFGPMDRGPLPGNIPLAQRVVDTGRELTETNGVVRFGAEQFTRMTGAWTTVTDDGRVVMRMNGPDGNMIEGRHMYLSYRIRFNTPGRYRLWGLMRSTGTEATDDVWVYWNREPRGQEREDYELKVASTNYAWGAAFKDLPPPEPETKRPRNRDFAENGLPVNEPGTYTLFIAKGEVSFSPDHKPGTDADFFSFDAFVLKNVELGDSAPE